MERWISALLVVVGLINFGPVMGVVSAQVLADAYGIAPPDGDLLVLMRHRALLFGIVGSIILASAYWRHLQPTAIFAAAVSMLGFIGLALASGEYGAKVYNVMLIDGVGIVALVLAVVLRWKESGASAP